MEVRDLFKNLMARGRLGHAYIVWGHGGVVERARVSEDIVGMFELKPFLDCMMMVPYEGAIGIDAVREARRFLWQSPVRSSRKTLVVNEAQALTTEAQNALLKIVEEPPQHGLIIFTLPDFLLLTPALQSRMQKIYMPLQIKNQNAKIKINEDIKKFLAGSAKERKDFIKKLLEGDEGACTSFIEGLMAALAQDMLKNYRALGELSRRWMLMNQFQTNRKLQLEAVLAYI